MTSVSDDGSFPTFLLGDFLFTALTDTSAQYSLNCCPSSLLASPIQPLILWFSTARARSTVSASGCCSSKDHPAVFKNLQRPPHPSWSLFEYAEVLENRLKRDLAHLAVHAIVRRMCAGAASLHRGILTYNVHAICVLALRQPLLIVRTNQNDAQKFFAVELYKIPDNSKPSKSTPVRGGPRGYMPRIPRSLPCLSSLMERMSRRRSARRDTGGTRGTHCRRRCGCR